MLAHCVRRGAADHRRRDGARASTSRLLFSFLGPPIPGHHRRPRPGAALRPAAAAASAVRSCSGATLPLPAARCPLRLSLTSPGCRKNTRLVIIDSMAAQLRSEFEAHESMARANTIFGFARQLKRMASEHGLAVLCINQVAGEDGWALRTWFVRMAHGAATPNQPPCSFGHQVSDHIRASSTVASIFGDTREVGHGLRALLAASASRLALMCCTLRLACQGHSRPGPLVVLKHQHAAACQADYAAA